MSWELFVLLIILLGVLYYGYENKKKFDLKKRELELKHELKIKEIELEQKKIDLEIHKIGNAVLTEDEVKEEA